MNDEISKAALEEAKKLTTEVYSDLAKPSIQTVGEVTGRTVKALLSPLRGFLWAWEKIEALIEEGINNRLKSVPEERRKSPEPEIAVPLIQALTYTAQNETLREMYLNLLANSMDTSKEKDVHPSFVDMIKQMDRLDAKVFEKASLDSGYQRVINPNIGILNSASIHVDSLPEWYTGWEIEGYTPFDISTSLIRLSKFGLLELMYDRTAGDSDYHEILSNPYLQGRLKLYNEAIPDTVKEIKHTKSILFVNDYGKQFRKACQK